MVFPGGRRGRLVVSLTAAIAVFATLATGAQAVPERDEASLAPVDGRVLDEIGEHGRSTFWVIMKAKADLSPAYRMRDWNARGRFVHRELRAVADSSQAGVRNFLTSERAAYQTFWIANAVRVTAGLDTLDGLRARRDVARIERSRTYRIPRPRPTRKSTIQTVEWNIERVRAPEVWETFGTRGEGIVVANIDTGVDYTHPALVSQYRGNLGDDQFDHNYNWHDPSEICGSPSLEPCDNAAHGTHTMGTMVGDDGEENQIGVAPGAKWIAAKGCEDFSCSDFALLSSGEWVMAPTDLNGENPRPDLRPNVVTNSWGNDNGADTFYQEMVQAWLASGIFPSFSNGNAGEGGCGTVGSPASYPESYGAGAFDINDQIAFFSSRGPSPIDGGIKPDISAPGVDVRSSVPGNSYDFFSGTSMAAPHVSGVVALIWSVAPAILGDVEATREVLDLTAVDTPDEQCGGEPEDNNVWGEGKLDAFAAVDQAPRGPTGTLEGTVTEQATGDPIAGASIEAEGPSSRSTLTGPDGSFSLLLPVGDYDVTATAFGFLTRTQPVTIEEDVATNMAFRLRTAPTHAVSGRVAGAEGPIQGAKVSILGTPLPTATTDEKGRYSFPSVPEGIYDVQASASNCNEVVVTSLTVNGPETLNFTLQRRTDVYGYFCSQGGFRWIEGETVLGLTGDDASSTVNLPFAFTFYGETYDQAFISTNGNLNFLGPEPRFDNGGIPDPLPPNAAIYAFWDDLVVEGEGAVRVSSLGSAPNRKFVIEWHNVARLEDFGHRIDAEIILNENGTILLQYRNLSDEPAERGSSATIGIEDPTGTIALQYSANQAALQNRLAILFDLPPNGFVQGQVLDANDGLPLAGASVTAMDGAEIARQDTTDEDGNYRLQLFVGGYVIEASKENYETRTGQARITTDGQTLVRNFVLRAAQATLDATALEFVMTEGQRRTAVVTMRNDGTLGLEWSTREAGGGQATILQARGGAMRPQDANARTTRGVRQGPTTAAPAAPGDIIRSWPTNLPLGWGVGYTGNVWISNVLGGEDVCGSSCENTEFDVNGTPTGRTVVTPWAGAWPGDMAYDQSRGIMCQVDVGSDNGIHCWDPDTGDVVDSITGSFPWTTTSQRGLAYRPDDDTFYIGGWNEGILYHIKGLSYADKGAVIGQCNPADGNISGLAWNPAFGVVWAATNTENDTIYQLNPDDCSVQGTLAHPQPGFNGAGLEMDEAGNLWMMSQFPNNAYLMDSGVPAFSNVPWLRETPDEGTLDPGGEQRIAVTVNSTGLEPGVYNALIFLFSNSGRNPNLTIPVRLLVPAYEQGVNVGGIDRVRDSAGDAWDADQDYEPGDWGAMTRGLKLHTRLEIAGTEDDSLYQQAREAVDGVIHYRFDSLPDGVYQVDLRFAELRYRRASQRLFDVILDGGLVLAAHDIYLSAGGAMTADDHTFFVEVRDGRLDVRMIGRAGFGQPLLNALRVRHRPDM